jgi:hypothetical protein
MNRNRNRTRVTFDPGSQCVGKQRHASREHANAARVSLGDLNCVVYRCPHCNGWHIGHAVGWIGKRAFAGLSLRR